VSKTLKFESREAASVAAAARIAGLVNASLNRDESAAFVFGGGSTPGQCFEYLSGYELDWKRVQVVLSDERWVPNSNSDSNERLIRTTLLVGNASAASVLPIYQDDLSVDERCDSLQDFLPPGGFACSMIGMGADGHFASLFPDADSLDAGLKLDNQRFYMPVRTEASPHPRISMTLHAIMQSPEILLLFFGEEKLAVYEQALAGDESYPITALLAQEKVPVSLYWAP
jgi:6-phosphogluconolactonase